MKLSEKEQKEFDQSVKDWQEMEILENKKNLKILDDIKLKVSDDIYKEILIVIEESENTYNFQILDKPKGKFQDEDDFVYLGGFWVDQTTNGGYTGDEYAGTVSIKIDEDVYLQFNYSM